MNGLPDIDLDEIYAVDGQSWYQVQPYSFQFAFVVGTLPVTKEIFLPISPSNLSITTHMAINTTATFTSVVEEHSNIKFYEITIQGTTGISPKYVDVESVLSINGQTVDVVPDAEVGRKSYNYSPISFGGFFQKTAGAYNAIKEQLDSQIESGVYTDKNGYLAFHNLYRFFVYYKQNIMENVVSPIVGVKSTSMIFMNRKDGNKYSVAPKTFSLVRSAESPMLYNYTISLIGYDMLSLDADVEGESDGSRLASLGLGPNVSILSFITKYAKKLTNIASALKGGIKGFGS